MPQGLHQAVLTIARARTARAARRGAAFEALKAAHASLAETLSEQSSRFAKRRFRDLTVLLLAEFDEEMQAIAADVADLRIRELGPSCTEAVFIEVTDWLRDSGYRNRNNNRPYTKSAVVSWYYKHHPPDRSHSQVK